MKIGISAYNLRAHQLLDIARAAERAGFDSLWLGEHLVLPLAYQSVHPATTGLDRPPSEASSRIIDPATELLDPWTALSAVAAVTSTIRVATGIYLLPLRHPLATARAAATLADLSDNRFLLGVGAGWLREEFEAFEVRFQDRGARHEESLRILRAAFAGGPFHYEGNYFRIPWVQLSERPIRVPLILGGNSEPALRRAVRLGDGWFASGSPSFAEALRLRDRLEQLRRECGRPEHLNTYVRMPNFQPDQVEKYAIEGFDSVIIWAHHIATPGTEDVDDAFRRAARELRLP